MQVPTRGDIASHAPCVRIDVVRPTAGSAGRRVATHTGRHKSSLPRSASPCRQDTRVGGVRQSARASSSEAAVSEHSAIVRDPRACAVAEADQSWRSPGCAPCRPDRVDLACGCGPTRGSRCWGLVLIPPPSSATIGRGSAPDSRSHGLCHSSVCSIVLTWQHLSPSGLTVLHLELGLKQ